MPSATIADLLRLTEADIVEFEARMREAIPVYVPGDRVELHGEVFDVAGLPREGMPGYWLRPGRTALFLPADLEEELRPVVH